VSRARNEDRVEIVLANEPIEMRVDEIEPWGRSPMAEQSRFDMLDSQWLPEQGIGAEVYLADRQVIRGAPVGID
jgi:hypothetical protein